MNPFNGMVGKIDLEIQVPPDLDREGLEHYRGKVERLLDRLTLEAEAWAEAGTRKVNQENAERIPSRHRLSRRRVDARHALTAGRGTRANLDRVLCKVDGGS